MPFIGRTSVAWIAALAAVLAFLIVDTTARIRHLTGMEKQYGVQVAAPIRDESSPTGYALGRRNFVEPGNTADTYHWVMQTQAMLAGGPWRMHRVDYDNAPWGRPMHWASPPRWGLALLAWADRGWSGLPLGAAAEQAVLFANPLFLGLGLLVLIPVIARRFGSSAAALLAIGAVSSYPFYLNFIAGNAEHQGAAEACALLTVIGLLGGAAGCVRPERTAPGLGRESDPGEGLPTPRQARNWFLVSAIAGGIGLWFSAASEAPVLAATGLGAIAALMILRRQDGPAAGILRPELWRIWGATGCAVSFAAYAIEYFPGQMGWRLEVNHPLYGLAWLGGGELLCQLARYWAPPTAAARRPQLGLAIGAGALIALLPAVVGLTSGQTFWVADPFLWRMHTAYIAEFQSMRWFLVHGGWGLSPVACVLALLVSVPPLFFLLRRGPNRFWKAQLALALVPAAVEFALTAQQVRWWGLASGIACATLLPFFGLLERLSPGARSRAWRFACALMFVPGAVNALTLIHRESNFSPENLWEFVNRDIAQSLRLRAGQDPVVVLSTPNTTTSLIYHGSLRGLGTLYWENRAGLKAAAEIFAASTDQAYALIQRRQVTHIVLASWDPFAATYIQLALGRPAGSGVPPGSFTNSLLGGSPLPPWLRAIPYPLPKTASLQGQHVLVLEVTAPQAARDIVVHNAAYLMEMGHLDEAAHLQPDLRRLDSYLPALAELARIQGELGDEAGVESTIARIAALGAAPADLAAEDQVRLAVALVIGGRLDAARQMLERCVQRMDERTLRHLTAGTESDLVSSCTHLGVSFPDSALQRLSAELVPPDLR
jgi:hypothetical protein